MGTQVGLRGGLLSIDLTDIEMTAAQQQELLQEVQATVVGHLARQFAATKVVAISMSPNNGTQPNQPKPTPSPEPDPPPRLS